MESRNLIYSSAVQALSFIAGLAAVFILMPYMIGKLGDYYYGLWIMISTVTGYFALSEFGVTSAVQNKLSVSLGENDRQRYMCVFSNGFFLYMVISLVAMLLIGISCAVIFAVRSRFLEPHLIISVLCITGLNLAVAFVFNPYLSVLKSHIRFDVVGGVAIFHVAANAALTILALYLGYGLVMVATVTLAVGMASNLLVFAAARMVAPGIGFRREHVNREDLKGLLSYSGKTFMAQIGDVLKLKIDELVAGAFISVNQVTHYAVASRMNRRATGLSLRVLGILTPLFTRYVGMRDFARLGEMFRLSIKLSAAYSSCLFAGFLILGAPFIRLWQGPVYLDAYRPLAILAAAFFIAGAQSPGISVLYAANRHEYFAYMNFFEGLAKLALALLFVIAFGMGITGVALANLVPVLVTKLAVQPLVVSRLVGMKNIEYHFLLLKVIAPGILFYGLVFVSQVNFPSAGWMSLAVYGMILGCISIVHTAVVLNKTERGLVVASVRKVLWKKPA